MNRDPLTTALLVICLASVAVSVLLVLAAAILLIGKALIVILSVLLLIGVTVWLGSSTGETSGKAPDGTQYGGIGG